MSIKHNQSDDFNPYPEDLTEKVSAEVVLASPFLAKTLREDCHYERQRALSSANVKRLAHEMSKGWFIAGTPIYLCVLPDGSMKIANGNHTLEAVRASGVTIPLVFIYRKVSDLDEVGRIYATFDLHKARTWKNALQATSADEGFPMANKVVAAVALIMEGFKAGNLSDVAQSRAGRIKKMAEYKTAAGILASAWSDAPAVNRRLMWRAPILAVALETARYQPRAAIEFWDAVAKDDGLSATDPRKLLLRYCTNTNVIGHAARVAASRAAANAWNAWYEERAMEKLSTRSDGPFRLLGTPWHGNTPAASKPRLVTGIQTGTDGSRPTIRFEE